MPLIVGEDWNLALTETPIKIGLTGVTWINKNGVRILFAYDDFQVHLYSVCTHCGDCRMLNRPRLMLVLGIAALAVLCVSLISDRSTLLRPVAEKRPDAQVVLPKPPNTLADHRIQTSSVRPNAPAVSKAFGHLPLSFEANCGQTAEQVKFLSRGNGYTLFLTPNEMVFSLRKPQPALPPSLKLQERLMQGRSPAPMSIETAVLRMKLVGAAANPRISGIGEMPGKSNYFIGNDQSKWRADVPHYGQVKYEGLYPGVDLVYYGNETQLEYDFVVAPGADPHSIQLKMDGVDELRVDSDGRLLMKIAGIEFQQEAPIAYQTVNGQRQLVTTGYKVDNHRVEFELGPYDTGQELTIDPILVYSMIIGGTDKDDASSIAVDGSNNVYISGTTYSADFPTATPFQGTIGTAGTVTAFVTKIDASGSFLSYSTYLGGSSGDVAISIAVDTAGNAYVTGFTYSTNFPMKNPIQGSFTGFADMFITKLNASGNTLVYSTYIGGSSSISLPSIVGRSIVVDSSGSAYVTGNTNESDIPLVSPIQATFGGLNDAFAMKVNSAGSALVYSTYLGGSGQDNGEGIAVDLAGNAYVTGSTASANFPTASPFQANLNGATNGFVAKLNASGSALVYSTYLGGSNNDFGLAIAVDSTGKTFVAGQAGSSDFPLVNPIQGALLSTNNGFVTEINAAGSALIYSTYLGGTGSDTFSSIAIDTIGNAFVTGQTYSTDFPVRAAIQPMHAGVDVTGGVFATEIAAGGSSVVYSTYLEGNTASVAGGIAVDSNGMACISGGVTSTGPTPNDNAFVVKINAIPPIAYSQQVTTRHGASLPITLSGADITNATLTYSISTSPSHGTLSGTPPSITYTPNASFAGTDNFTFVANNGTTNGNLATVTISVTNPANPVTASKSLSVHTGVATAVALVATDADNDPLTFSIVSSPGHGTLTGTPPNVTYTSAAYAGTDSFTFKANDGVADSNIATVTITVTDQTPQVSLTATPTILIEGQSVAFNSGATDPEGDTLTFTWTFGDGGTSTDAIPTHVYATAGVYNPSVSVTDISGATVTQSITIQIFQDSDRPTARFVSSDLNGFVGQPVGYDASFSTDPLNNIVSYDWDFGDGSPHGSQQIISRVYAAEGTYTVTLTITDGRGLTDTTTLTMVILPAAQAGLLNPNIKYSVSWNRGATNADSLSLSATVNVGTTSVNNASPLSLGVVGQTFTGTSATKLSLSRSSKSGPQVKWQIKANKKKGTPKGTYDLKCTIKHASLGQAFALAGVTGTKSSTAKIPLRLGIGGSSFESSINSQFRFGGSGAKASGGGQGPK